MARRPLALSTWLVALLAVAASVAVLIPHNPRVALIVAVAVAVLGISLWDPMLLPIFAAPGLVAAMRVGGGSVDLAFSDALLFAAFWAALFFAPRPMSRHMRQLLWLSGIYQALSLFTLIANPFHANTVEWFHAWVLVGGAMLVGWAIGASDRAGVALGLFALACTLVAGDAVLIAAQQLAHGVTTPVYPQWPVPLAKNFAGPLLSWAALLAFARPAWLRWPPWFSYTVLVVCSLGTLAAQSRQALLGLGFGMVLIAFRPGLGARRASRVLLICFVPALAFVASSVRSDLSGQNQFNSTALRLPGYESGFAAYHLNPLFGSGLRWWTTGIIPGGFQPPNAEIEVLSSVGIVGLLGFLILIFGTLVVGVRMRPEYGTVAVAILGARFIQSQFDQFWVSSMVSTPFLILGVCVGAEALALRRRSLESEGATSALHELQPPNPSSTRLVDEHPTTSAGFR